MSKAEIVLINPNAGVESVSKIGISTPPLGLGYIASVLRKNGFKVKIIDDIVEKLDFSTLIKKIKNCIIVGITSTTPTFNAALKYARKIKEKLPNIFTILGGVHVSFLPYDALKHEYVDAVCIGEGEYTMLEVAERVEKGKSLEGVKGMMYRDKNSNRIVNCGKREFISNLDELPFPAFDLMPLDKYSLLGKKLECFPMMTSRGCPFNCRYCSSSLFFGKKFRARSAKNIVDEMEWLINDFGAKHIAFSDDTFTLNRKRVEEICNEIKRRNIDITWSCSSRVDTVNENLLRNMKASGCEAIYYGIESANPAVLQYYRKNITPEKARDAVKITKKIGISTICSFIIGAPFETEEDIKRTLNFAIKLNPDYAQFSILTPYPGTELYKEAERENLLLTKNFSEYTAGKPVLRNKFLSPEELKRLLHYCYRKFYLRPSFILKELRKRRIHVVLKIIKKFLMGKESLELS